VLKRQFLYFAFSFIAILGYGQDFRSNLNQPGSRGKGLSDEDISARQKEDLIKMYYKTFASSNDFIDGREYFNYAYRSKKTTPLLSEAKNFDAILFMDGRRYGNIRLEYDTYLDEIIYIDTSRVINYQFPKVVLRKEAVDGFTLINGSDSMKFRHLRYLNDKAKNSDGGYFEVVYDGITKYIIRHRSKLFYSDARDEYKYAPEKLVYAGGQYHVIKNNKELSSLFSSRSKEVSSFLRKSRVNVRRAGKYEMALILKYCDSLLNNSVTK
jgi:hypothetical protein